MKSSIGAFCMGIGKRLVEVLLYFSSPLVLLITAPIIAQGLGPSARGELGFAQSILSFAVALGALGQSEVFTAQRRSGSGDFYQSASVIWIAGSFCALIAAFIANINGLSIAVILTLLISIPLLSQGSLWRAVSILQQRLRGPALANGIAAILRICLIFMLFWFEWISVGTIFVVIQIAVLLGLVFALGFFAWRTESAMKSSYRNSGLRSLAISGIPLIIFSVFTSFTLNGSILILKFSLDSVSLGIFVACSSLSIAVLTVSGAFKARAQAALLRPRAKYRFNQEVLITLAFSAIAALIGHLMSPLLIDVLLGPGYERGVPVLQILTFASAGLMMLDVIHGSLAVIGCRWLLVMVSAIGSVSTLVGLIFLVPRWGIEGAALTSLIAYTIPAILGWFFVNNFLRANTNTVITS